MILPITFHPLPFERVWGGAELAKRFGKPFPTNKKIGESWEIVDRPEAQSIVREGEWQGHSLHDLWQNHREGLFGRCYGGHPAERFPILIKLLDARETLSVQVHPPAHRAAELGGEPKTEVWHFLAAEPDACIYAGIRPDITPQTFSEMLSAGTVEHALHRIPVRVGDSIFIPSGRIHALGGGLVLAEVQQNSDTTYRVFDWNRTGLDGKPRELHIAQSLASIDFSDTAPALNPPGTALIADCPFFRVEKRSATPSLPPFVNERFCIWAITRGSLLWDGQTYNTGQLLLLPAGMTAQPHTPDPASLEFLEITLPIPSWEAE